MFPVNSNYTVSSQRVSNAVENSIGAPSRVASSVDSLGPCQVTIPRVEGCALKVFRIISNCLKQIWDRICSCMGRKEEPLSFTERATRVLPPFDPVREGHESYFARMIGQPRFNQLPEVRINLPDPDLEDLCRQVNGLPPDTVEERALRRSSSYMGILYSEEEIRQIIRQHGRNHGDMERIPGPVCKVRDSQNRLYIYVKVIADCSADRRPDRRLFRLDDMHDLRWFSYFIREGGQPGFPIR